VIAILNETPCFLKLASSLVGFQSNLTLLVYTINKGRQGWVLIIGISLGFWLPVMGLAPLLQRGISVSYWPANFVVLALGTFLKFGVGVTDAWIKSKRGIDFPHTGYGIPETEREESWASTIT
jgi:hypothetical protein